MLFRSEFDNTNITLNNYNASIGFDGKFSFSGKSENFTIISPSNNLVINYIDPVEEDAK